MAKPPGRPPRLNTLPPAAQDPQQVPTANVNILRSTLGVDVTTEDPQRLQAAMQTITRSMSASPYTSADMLYDYVQRGFPDLPGKVIAAIDQQVAHRQALEKLELAQSSRREDRAQLGAQILGMTGLVAALVAGYFGVPGGICITVAIIAIGGPNAATIAARLLDRFGR